MHQLLVILLTLFVSISTASAESVRANRNVETEIALERATQPAKLSEEQERLVDNARKDLIREVRNVLSHPVLRPAVTGVKVTTTNGEVIYQSNHNVPLNPASNVKLLSTAAALDALGPDHRYKTMLMGPAPDNGVVDGDVYLLGEWDPTLFETGMRNIARQLAEKGITEIRGDIVLDHRKKRDVLMEKSVRIEVKGGRYGQPAEIKMIPHSDYFEIVNEVKTRGSTRVRAQGEVIIENGRERLQLKITGRVRKYRRYVFRRRVPSRHAFTAEVLRYEAREAGVTFDGDIVTAPLPDYLAASSMHFLPVELARHYSRPLSSIVASVNKRSINWLADGVVNTAAARVFGGEPTMTKGVALMNRWLQKHTPEELEEDTFYVDTGSGLSYNTKMTSDHIVTILRNAAQFGMAEPGRKKLAFRESLAVGGVDGTLRRRYRRSDARGRVRGKTGTLTKVIALSGAVNAEGGEPVIFSFVSNGHKEWHRHRVRLQMDEAVDAIHEYSEQVAEITKK